MTDKEMAEQFADNINGLDLTCSLLSAKDKRHAYRLGRYDGFLAGLKAGRPQWHYVKDEKDLPTDKKEYLLLLGSNIRTFGFYNGRFWESWKGDFSWQEVKAYFFVPVPEPKESE